VNAWVSVYRKSDSAPHLNDIWEGEVPVADQQNYRLADIVGNGLAKVTVGREMSKNDYGTGGKVFVSVTITCNQDDALVEYAKKCASALAERYVVEEYNSFQQTLYQNGLVK
jgi:hypothetical protein